MAEPTGDRYFRLLTSYAIVVYGVQLCTTMLSVCAVRISQAVALGIIGFSVSAGLVYGLRARADDDQKPREDVTRMMRVLASLVIGVSLVVWLGLLAAANHAPDVSWDGNAYHIPTVALWDAQGYVHWVHGPYSNMINCYPKAAELVAYILVKALGDSGLLNAVNLLFLPLGVLGVASITRSLGASSIGALFAGMALVLVPVNISQGVTTYVDSAFASSVIAYIAVVLAAAKTARPTRFVFPMGVSMALLLGIKSSGLAIAALGLGALAIVWGIKALRRPETPVWRTLPLLTLCLLAVVLLALPGSYWYIRNYIQTGTPLYPVGVSIGGRVVFPGVSASLAMQEADTTPPEMRGWSPLRRIASTWLQGLHRWPSSIRYPESRWGGLGFLWLAGCVPAVVLLSMLHTRRPRSWQGLWLLLGLTGAAFLAMPMNWWARYTAWIYAAGLPCFVLLLEEALRNGRSALVAGAWAGLCVGLLIFEGGYTFLHTVDSAFPGSLVQDPRSALVRDNWHWPPSYLFPDLNGTVYDQVLEHGRVVAIGPANWPADPWPIFGIMGQLSQPIGSRKIVLLTATSSRESILERQVDFIVWDKKVPVPAPIAAITAHTESAGAFLVLRIAGRPEVPAD